MLTKGYRKDTEEVNVIGLLPLTGILDYFFLFSLSEKFSDEKMPKTRAKKRFKFHFFRK